MSPIKDAAVDLAALREYLASRDEGCPSCSYNLRGLTSDRCPECDELLVLRVHIAEPRLGAWLGVLSGLLAAAGGALVCMMIVGYMGFRHRDFPGGREFFPIVVYPVILLVVHGGAALAIASPLGRRWFRARSGPTRVALMFLSWGLLVGAVALFLRMVVR